MNCRTLGVVLTIAVVAVSVAAASADAGTIKLSGTQTIVDEAAGKYAMTGSLVGTWNVTAFKENYSTRSSYVGSGKERFAGCLDSDGNGTCDAGEPTGAMSFTFIYWATFDPATKALVRGACVHPVAGATGGFASAKGVIFMKDTPVGAKVKTTYTGSLTGPSFRTTTARATAGRTLAARASMTCGR
jgi:hypothetical protein